LGAKTFKGEPYNFHSKSIKSETNTRTQIEHIYCAGPFSKTEIAVSGAKHFWKT
jgi:hypothetical protein